MNNVKLSDLRDSGSGVVLGDPGGATGNGGVGGYVGDGGIHGADVYIRGGAGTQSQGHLIIHDAFNNNGVTLLTENLTQDRSLSFPDEDGQLMVASMVKEMILSMVKKESLT